MTVAAQAVTVAGLRMQYIDVGSGEPILYLHGAGGRPPAGASFVEMMGARHRLLLPSRPGFDETPVGDTKTLVDVAQVMAAFVQAVAESPVHVVGQSAGAAVAAWLAVLHPKLVKSLVLSAPSTFEVRPPATGRPTPEEIEYRLYGDCPSWSAPPGADERARIQRNAAAYMTRGQHGSDGNTDLLERLAEIAAPTLVIWGTGDRMLLPESALPFQRHIPGCLRLYIYGAAHEMPISAASSWVRLVTDFIDRGEAFAVNQG